jgi:sugar/nucleoside kinase (ribokinase family)
MSASYFAIGNVSIDDLVFVDGTTMWCVPGGNAIYSALGMAVWGERPQVIAPIGPEYPVDALNERIDLTRCRRLDRTLRDWGLYEEDGTRQFIFRTKTRNWIDFCPTPDDLDGGPYTYCHLAPLPWSLHMELAGLLRARGAELISVDPDDRRLSEVSRADLKKLLGLVDLFLPSRQDAEAIFPGRPPLDALKALRDLAPEVPVVMIKCGSAGAIAHERDAREYIAVPAVAQEMIDETGAGDSFCGACLVGFARNRDVAGAVACATVSASFAVEGVGPSALVGAPAEIAEQRLSRLRSSIELRTL